MKTAYPNQESSHSEQNSGRVSSGTPTENIMVIPVIQEQVSIDTKVVESGRVHISKTVSEQQESVSVPLNHEEVNVERVQKNEYVDTPPPPVRHEGDTMIIPVLREVVVVEKRLLLVEELHVTKKQVQTEDVRQVTLRKEEVNVVRSFNEDEVNVVRNEENPSGSVS